ncbi:putative ribonuclease H-like domain-containing protein [Tanacetum coccineum]
MIDYALWEVIENGATLPKIAVVEGVEKVMPITSAKDKDQRRLEVKARSTLMMGIPNEHQLKFNSIKDAKLLLEAIEKRFEMLDQTFDRLQKLVIQLDLLDEKLSQEDVNKKLLRSLSPEWNTHAVVWRNKAELDTMSMDDLYNNLKTSTISSNEAVNAAHRITTASTQNTKKDASVNVQLSPLVFDKSKVECYNCRQEGHFSRDCKLQEIRQQEQESSRRSLPCETTLLLLHTLVSEMAWVAMTRVIRQRNGLIMHSYKFANDPVVENSKAKFSEEDISSHDDGSKPSSDDGKKFDEDLGKDSECKDQEKEDNVNSTNNVNAASINEVNVFGGKTSIELSFDLNMPALEDYSIFDSSRDDEDDGTQADMNNLDTTIQIGCSRYTQEEGIDYDEVFAPVARIEAIRLFLAYAIIEKIIGVSNDEKVISLGKMKKSVSPRAWYETLSTYLLDNGFQRGKINKTLFIKRHKGDILLVQVYVDDIIFGSTKKELCNAFEKLCMKFQMSSMGELTFFLGLQVQQKKDGIFISQDKYVVEILKKFRFTEVKTASTPMETQKPLLKMKVKKVIVHMYRSMIGSLMYLTSSRPDIMFAVCACARYQVNPKVSHLHAVKRIFWYLKGQPKLGLWYLKDSPFDLVAYTDSDYAGVSLDRKSTTGSIPWM